MHRSDILSSVLKTEIKKPITGRNHQCTTTVDTRYRCKLVLLLLADSSKTSKASQNRGEMHLCAFLWRMKFERSVRTSEECKEKRRAERKDGMEKAEATSKQHTA
ncbi:unnamed protein product, partial [Wuchereria bancrofti]